MKIFALVTTLLPLSLWANSYDVRVIAEAGSEDAALEFIENFRNIEPFKQLAEKGVMKIETAPITVTGLNCRGGNSGIARLAQCDMEKIKSLCGDVDMCPVYTTVPEIGAGNPKYPIVSSSFPWTTMLHEVVHAYGFTDEYAYSRSETTVYCPDKVSWHNGHSHVTKRGKEEYYQNASDAEASCRKLIPWCKDAIDAGAIVVQAAPNGKFIIGSPPPVSCPSVLLGVYPGGSCQAKSPFGTWRPYFCPTVMGYPTLGEENCPVSRRHRIIKNSPNLLPEHYQKSIFAQIVSAAGRSNVKFEARENPVLTHHAYGIPEIDRLSGHDEGIDFCKDSRVPSSVKAPPKDSPHAECFSKHR